MLGRDCKNIFSLYGIQAANAVFPLIVFPHLLRVCGQQFYSQVAMSEAVALAVLTISLYSFDIDAPARVVGLDLKHHATSVSIIFSGVLFARLALFLVGAPLSMVGCWFLAPSLLAPLAWWLLLPLSHLLQSAWLFQGLERNGPIAVAMIISRITCIVAILALVNRPEQHLMVPALVGSMALAGALGLLAYAHISLRVRLCWVPIAEVLALFRNGRIIFFGNSSVFMYRDMNVLLLAAAGAGAPAVAAYSIAEKWIKGLQAAARPLNQYFFPKAILAIRGRHRADRGALCALLRMTLPQLAALFILVTMLVGVVLIATHHIPVLREWPERRAISFLLVLMAPAVFFGILNFMVGSIGLNHLGERKYLFFSLLLVGGLNLGVCYVLSRIFGGPGAALAFVISEALLAGLIVRRYFCRAPIPGKR